MAKAESKELKVVKTYGAEVFSATEKVDEVLNHVRTEVGEFQLDRLNIEDAAAQGTVRSVAYMIARAKTTLDGAGKDAVAAYKQKIKDYDANRKRLRDGLEELQEAVRKPLTDLEEKEKVRIAELDQRVAAIEEFGADCEWMDSESLSLRLASLDATVIDASFQEREDQAFATMARTRAKLVQLQNAAKEREAAEQQAREAEEKAAAEAAAEQESAVTEPPAQPDGYAATGGFNSASSDMSFSPDGVTLDDEMPSEPEDPFRLEPDQNEVSITDKAATSLVIHTGLSRRNAMLVIEAIERGVVEHVAIVK